jgi:hypothetical protein
MNKIIELYENYHWAVATALTVFLLAIVLGLAFGVMCLQAWLVMLLWNWIAVDLFGAPVLGFWMAFGLHWLCSLLFKSKVTVNKKSED